MPGNVIPLTRLLRWFQWAGHDFNFSPKCLNLA